jgi:hypothetical protein
LHFFSALPAASGSATAPSSAEANSPLASNRHGGGGDTSGSIKGAMRITILDHCFDTLRICRSSMERGILYAATPAVALAG